MGWLRCRESFCGDVAYWEQDGEPSSTPRPVRPQWLDLVAEHHKGEFMGRTEFITLCLLAGGTNANDAGAAWDDAPEPT